MKKYTKYYILCIMLIISLIVIFVVINNASAENKTNKQFTENMEGEKNNMNDFDSKINISINGVNYTATLEDNDTVREFLKRLPLEINMNELNGNEKYYYFNSSLPSNSSKVGTISSGDLMLYGDDCLVLFYESFNTQYSYTRIGKIDNPTSLKSNVGNGNIKILFTN